MAAFVHWGRTVLIAHVGGVSVGGGVIDIALPEPVTLEPLTSLLTVFLQPESTKLVAITVDKIAVHPRGILFILFNRIGQI